jgi:hypothetical protein
MKKLFYIDFTHQGDVLYTLKSSLDDFCGFRQIKDAKTIEDAIATENAKFIRDGTESGYKLS